MVHIDLLGTGTPIVDVRRCGSGTAISISGAWLLVDCGRGITHRSTEAGLDPRKLRAVAITHHHSDHISDLPTLAIARWTSGATDPLVVIAPEGPAAEFARSCLDPFPDQAFYAQAPAEAGLRPAIDVQAFDAPAQPELVGEIGPFQISSVLVDHHPIEAAVGYRVDVDKASIAISGDTAACSRFESIACNVDLLIHEALLASAVRPKLLEWNASAQSVGALAERARAKRLVLTHLLPPPATEEVGDRHGVVARVGQAGRMVASWERRRLTRSGSSSWSVRIVSCIGRTTS